jgi:hypothetical protein
MVTSCRDISGFQKANVKGKDLKKLFLLFQDLDLPGLFCDICG